MKISIKGRIVRSFCLLISLMLVAQLGFNIFFSKNVFVVQNKRQVESVYDGLVENYSDDTDVLHGLTREADTMLGYSIQVLSDDGVVYTSRTMATGDGVTRGEIQVSSEDVSLGEQPQGPLGGPGAMKPGIENPGDNMAHIQGQGPTGGRDGVYSYDLSEYSETPEVDIVTLEGSDMEVLTLRGKIYYEGEARYINIALPMESITNSVALFTKSNLTISLLVLLFGIWVVIEIANSITKPIKDMQKVSENLANLDFSHEVSEEAKTEEIKSLAQSINSMSKQLEKSMNELQRANVELHKDVERQKELDSMRKQFVANVSHEMKTPLALVQIYCDNLKHNVEGIDKEKYCDIIIEETNRLNKIVADMLNVSRLENGLLQPYMIGLDFSEVVINLVDTMKPLLDNYELTTDITPNLTVHGDKDQLKEAMRNYIMNAISHTKAGEAIRISVRESDDNVEFRVYNQGSHINESDKDRLWESFYKSDQSHTRAEGSNAGLGLYVVKLTLDNHKGYYGAVNENEGVTFIFGLKNYK